VEAGLKYYINKLPMIIENSFVLQNAILPLPPCKLHSHKNARVKILNIKKIYNIINSIRIFLEF